MVRFTGMELMPVESSSVLFEKAIPVRIKTPTEERQAVLTVRIFFGRAKNARKVLQVQIIDELDPFFLYAMEMSEDEFQNLKVEQCILVDFSLFPHKFIELLEHCLKPATDESQPRFLAVLNVRIGDSTLSILESNQFKHVSHLSLCFRQGNDSTLKTYLAGRLSDYKGVNVDLHEKLRKTLDSLEQSVHENNKLKEELSSVKGVHSRELTELGAKHTLDVSRIKEKAMQECIAMKEKLDRDRADMEYRLRLRADAQETHVSELDRQLRELTSVRYNLELKTAEYKSKLEAAEKDVEDRQQECSSLRKKNVSYDNKLQDYSKQINQHLIRLAALEQEVQAKNELLSSMSKRLDSELSHRAALELALRDAQAAAERAEEKATTSIADANRFSQAVERLQGELRACKAKVKLKAQVAAQQDTLLHERQATIEKNTADNNSMRQELATLRSENDALRRKVEDFKEKVEEMQEASKSNHQMIQWLNQQLTDSQLGKFGFLSKYSYKSGETRGFASQTLSSLAGNFKNALPQAAAHPTSSSPCSVATNSTLSKSTRAATGGSSPVPGSGGGISKVIFKPPVNLHSCSATPTPTPMETCSQTSVSIFKSDNVEANQRTFTVEMKRNKPQLSFAEPGTTYKSSSSSSHLLRTGLGGKVEEEPFSSFSSPVSTI